jgi:hypothetical protein
MDTELAEKVLKLLIEARHTIIRTQKLERHSLGPTRLCFIIAAPWIGPGRTISISSVRHLHGLGIPSEDIKKLENR